MSIDDLHWIDPASALLLRHLATAHDPAAILLITTCNDSELSGEHPVIRLLADVRRARTIDRLALTPLSEHEVGTLLSAWTAAPADTQRVAALWRSTGGNAFLVEQLLRAGQGSSAALPQGIHEVIIARLGRLAHETRETLLLAAVIGCDFTLDVLAPASELAEQRLLDAVDQALRARLISEDVQQPGSYRWSHALVRDLLYRELNAVHRAQLHARVLAALEQLDGPSSDERLERLAHHCARAAALGTAAKTVAYARAAGERAMAGLAFEAAAVHFQCALHALTLAGNDPATRHDLLLALQTAHARAGDHTAIQPARADTHRTPGPMTSELASGRSLLTGAGQPRIGPEHQPDPDWVG